MYNFNLKGLEGRPFSLGSSDCFSQVRDFYKLNFNIVMPDFSRPNDWRPEDDNLIDDLYEKAGFVKLDVDEYWPPRPADILVAIVGGSLPNHLLIYLGENKILHHKIGQFSAIETMRPAWKRYTSYILRHPEVPDLTPEKRTLTLQEAYHENLV